MARLFNGSSHFIFRTSAILSSSPLSVASWFNSASATKGQTIFALSSISSAVPFITLQASGDVAVDPVRLLVRDNSSNLPFAVTSTGYSINTWHHAAGVFAATDDLRAFIDGGSKGTDTAPVASGFTLNRTTLGVRQSTSNANYFEGKIAECGLWNVALTDFEIAILALGYSPLLVRPQSLVAYWPLIGRTSPEIDLVGGYDMSLNAAPTVAAHPAVIYPSRQIYTPFAPDTGGFNVNISPSANYIQVV